MYKIKSREQENTCINEPSFPFFLAKTHDPHPHFTILTQKPLMLVLDGLYNIITYLHVPKINQNLNNFNKSLTPLAIKSAEPFPCYMC